MFGAMHVLLLLLLLLFYVQNSIFLVFMCYAVAVIAAPSLECLCPPSMCSTARTTRHLYRRVETERKYWK